MADTLDLQTLRGLILSAAEIKALNPEWKDPMVEDYLNIIDNIITIAETVNTIIAETIEEVPTAFSDGSIPYVDSNLLVEDNTNLLWDANNNVLNISDAKISGLTASRLMATDSNKNVDSVTDLTAWIAGTTNQITVTDDTDGTVTLTLPQDFDTGADVNFGSVVSTGNITGANIITAGNVDGRDVSVDGAKLDGIDAGAEVNNISDANATLLTGGTNITIHYHSFVSGLKSGATAAAAGAATDELWVTSGHATLPDGVVMKG